MAGWHLHVSTGGTGSSALSKDQLNLFLFLCSFSQPSVILDTVILDTVILIGSADVNLTYVNLTYVVCVHTLSLTSNP